MKVISGPMLAHLATGTKLAVCLKMTRTDGVIVRGTNHDVDLHIQETDDSPPVLFTYLVSAGGTETDVQTSNAMNTDTVDQTGILSLDSITEADLHAGLYDYAAFSLFVVNWSDLSMGSYSLRDGNVGQVTLERDQFIAQLNGMMDAFKRSIGRLVTPLCPYNLGDFPFPANVRGRCTKDLSGGSPDSPSIPFTVTGTLESVSLDGKTLFDSARTEPGPSGGIAITGISNANPGVVTTATDLGLPDYATVMISGVVGATWANTVVVIRNPTPTSFELSIDTSDTGAYPAYVSDGTVTPLGGDSGWFDYGLVTIVGGDSPASGNEGLSREVKAYIPGQWTLQDAFPYPLTGTETYTMTAGCNKTSTTCKAKFDNLVNFGGFPFVPGQDKAIQVAQPQPAQQQGKK